MENQRIPMEDLQKMAYNMEMWEAQLKELDMQRQVIENGIVDLKSTMSTIEELDKLVSEWTANYTHYEVTEILQKAGVAAVPCLDTEERFFDPHLQERRTYLEVDHPTTGVDFVANSSWILSDNPTEIHHRSPMLGEHNSYVFKELMGISDDEISRLKAEKVIY